MPAFVAFGPAHLTALAVIAVSVLVLVGIVRRRPTGSVARAVRFGLAAALALLAVIQIVMAARDGWLSIEMLVPLHMCDAAILLALYALVTRQRLVSELLYFWACSGTALATLSPDLAFGFPHPRFFAFFGLHGLVIVSALVLVFGCRLAPRPGALWRVFALTNVYAAVVAVVNAAARTNFLYLCEKPPPGTLLDLMGPWPAYILASEVLAAALFCLLALPFRGAGQPERGN